VLRLRHLKHRNKNGNRLNNTPGVAAARLSGFGGAPLSTEYLQNADQYLAPSQQFYPQAPAAAPDPYVSYGGATTYNNNVGQYDQGINQINSALGNLGGQQASANSKIDSSYQDALNQLLVGKNQANESYKTNVLQNRQDYSAGKNTVRSRAGSSLNGLLRLFRL
jgi:hypothetical protein